MNSNANILLDPSKDLSGFSKLPTPAELAAMKRGSDSSASGDNAGAKKKELILGKFETVEALQTSYKELEQRLGTQGSEIGQLRQLTDKLLDLKKVEDRAKGGGQSGPVQVTSDELLRDPRAAIERVVGEKTADLEARLQSEQVARIKAEFNGRHPGYENDMQDPAFQTYIKGSQYRLGLASATIQGNLVAAEELWNGWEETKKAQTGKGQAKEAGDREQALRAATGMVTSGGSTGTADGDGSNTGKPIYSRQQLIMMKINNPSAYYDPTFQEMITQAYQEKRVR